MADAPPSYARALVYRVSQETWQRGVRYVEEGRVGPLEPIPKGFRAVVQGTQAYRVEIVWRGSGLGKRCPCPVSQGRNPCKHLIALAIVADQAQGIAPPDAEEVEAQTIPPPLISRAEIEALYRDPLNADLEVLRLAASEAGSWSRPHARLPNVPPLAHATGPLTLTEVERALKSLARWADHPHFDLYFCAGELMAGFCELLRRCRPRLARTSPEVVATILERAVAFHRRMIYELLDDSDGVHRFGDAHLRALLSDLRARPHLPVAVAATLGSVGRQLEL